MTQQVNFNKPLFSWSVFVGNDRGDQYHTVELIADSDNLVLEYLKANYNIDDMQDTSFDMDEFSFEITTFYNEDGEELEEIEEDNDDPNTLTEYVTAHKSSLSDKDLRYLLSGKYHTPVVDLTA